MKLCSDCKGEKDFSEFNRKGSGYQHRCRECQKAWYKEYYRKSPVEKQRILDKNESRRTALKTLIAEIKDVPCKDCGQRYPHYVMDFDHLGDKLFNVSTMAARLRSVESVMKEIAKCEVVCSNCHRIRTHARLDNCSLCC